MAKEALQSVGDIVKRSGDEKVIGSYYLEFSRSGGFKVGREALRT